MLRTSSAWLPHHAEQQQVTQSCSIHIPGARFPKPKDSPSAAGAVTIQLHVKTGSDLIFRLILKQKPRGSNNRDWSFLPSLGGHISFLRFTQGGKDPVLSSIWRHLWICPLISDCAVGKRCNFPRILFIHFLYSSLSSKAGWGWMCTGKLIFHFHSVAF